MLKTVRIAALLLIAAVAVVHSQEAQSGIGKSVDVSFDMAGVKPSVLRVRAGLDVARFLGLGVLWGSGFSDPGIVDLEVGVWCTAALLSEGEMGMPVSFRIVGSFAKVHSVGAALEDDDLVRSGTTALLGAELSRTFALSQRLGLLAALLGSYRFSTITTEAVAGSGSDFETLIEPSAEVLYGVRLGLSVAIAEHVSMLFALGAMLDGGFGVHYGPAVSLVSR